MFCFSLQIYLKEVFTSKNQRHREDTKHHHEEGDRNNLEQLDKEVKVQLALPYKAFSVEDEKGSPHGAVEQELVEEVGLGVARDDVDATEDLPQRSISSVVWMGAV